MHQEPRYIEKQELANLLATQASALPADLASWWQSHAVTPFLVRHMESAHYAVATQGTKAIFFADDEDEFGIGTIDDSGNALSSYGLIGDLADAIRRISGTA